MRKYFIIVTPSIVLIALLFLFVSADQVDTSQSPQLIKPVAVSLQKPEPPVDNHYKDQLAEAVTKYFQRALSKNKIVGAAVAIVKCDSIIYLDGFGNKNVALKDTITPETIFRVGSVSKGFAGILTGIHVQERILNWEDKIIDHIPNFKLANKKTTKEVTLSQVLSHTSGLPYHSFTNLVEDGLSLTTIAGRFNEVWPLQKPGTTYNYQNAAFALSGEIIERATGMPLGKVIQNKIFDPLQMTTASASYEALQKANNVAQPHYRIYGKWRTLDINKKYYNAIAAGGVNASATDMAKWMKFLLGNNPEVMTSETMKEVFAPIVQVGGRRQYYQRWPGYIQSFYGHGWRVHTFENSETGEPNQVIHHGGHVNNYRSEIAIYPQEDLGICILFNNPTKLARTSISDLHQIVKDIMSSQDLDTLNIVEEEMQQMNYF